MLNFFVKFWQLSKINPGSAPGFVLFFRSREEGFEKERNKNKDGNSRGATTS